MAQLVYIGVAALSGAAQLYKGKKAQDLKEQEAEGYRDAAKRRMAAATHEMAEERRNKEFMYSRALAVSAASGTATGSVGIINQLADINAEGEYRILARLYTGQDEAAGLRFRAEAAIREGESARDASKVNAIVSAVSSYAAFA